MTRLGSAALLLAMLIAAGCAATADDRAGSSDDEVHLGTPPDASADAPADAASPDVPTDAGAATDAAPPPRGPSTTAMAAKLAAIGLDVYNLPSLHDLPTSQKLKVMKTFNESMGVTCNTCHVSDYSAPTHRKELALFAWESIARKLTMADGGALYCDSCHYGKFDFLDRSNHHQLELWMKSNFVDQLHDKSGAPMACSTCHGTEPVATDNR